jgi:hypothetical protein
VWLIFSYFGLLSIVGGLGQLFSGDVFSKIASNPRLAPLLAQPDMVQKIKECQANPRMVNV